MIDLIDYVYVDVLDSELRQHLMSALDGCDERKAYSYVDISVDEFDLKLKTGNARRYCILTDNVHRMHKLYLSNNVVDCVNKPYDKIMSELNWVLSDFGRMSDMSKTYFWSDPHFCHKNIIKYCKRPWYSECDENGCPMPSDADVVRMNEDLIQRFNAIVKPNDIVWCLGDFAFAGKCNVAKCLSRLNGDIRLVKGNHDKQSNQFYLDAGFKWVYDHPVIINDFIILSHEPLGWLNSDMPYVNLFGHVHNQTLYKHFTSNTYNCCVEMNDYKPVSWKHIENHFKNMGVE